MATKVPSFSGNEDFAKWLKSFRQAMLIMDFDDNPAKMASLFDTCVQDGSTAASWYDSIDMIARSDWTTLLPLLKARFETDPFTRENATRAFLGLALRDSDVGELGEKNIERQIIFINKAVDLAAKCTMDAPTAKLCIMERMGYEIRSLVQRSTPTPETLQDIQTIILHLTASDIYHIRKEVRREAADRRNFRAPMQPNQAFPRQQTSPNYQAISPQYPAYQMTPTSTSRPFGPTSGANNASISVPTGPFSNNAAGMGQYNNAVTLFYQKFGANATSGMNRPFPLTPGTLPVGSFECWSCGKSGHMRQNCTGPFVPDNEQRFRGIASQSVRKQEPPQPIRMISNQSTPYDSYDSQSQYETTSPSDDPIPNRYDIPPHFEEFPAYPDNQGQGNDWESKW